jgi:hypothetical protein
LLAAVLTSDVVPHKFKRDRHLLFVARDLHLIVLYCAIDVGTVRMRKTVLAKNREICFFANNGCAGQDVVGER